MGQHLPDDCGGITNLDLLHFNLAIFERGNSVLKIYIRGTDDRICVKMNTVMVGFGVRRILLFPSMY